MQSAHLRLSPCPIKCNNHRIGCNRSHRQCANNGRHVFSDRIVPCNREYRPDYCASIYCQRIGAFQAEIPIEKSFKRRSCGFHPCHALSERTHLVSPCCAAPILTNHQAIERRTQMAISARNSRDHGPVKCVVRTRQIPGKPNLSPPALGDHQTLAQGSNGGERARMLISQPPGRPSVCMQDPARHASAVQVWL